MLWKTHVDKQLYNADSKVLQLIRDRTTGSNSKMTRTATVKTMLIWPVWLLFLLNSQFTFTQKQYSIILQFHYMIYSKKFTTPQIVIEEPIAIQKNFTILVTMEQCDVTSLTVVFLNNHLLSIQQLYYNSINKLYDSQSNSFSSRSY